MCCNERTRQMSLVPFLMIIGFGLASNDKCNDLEDEDFYRDQEFGIHELMHRDTLLMHAIREDMEDCAIQLMENTSLPDLIRQDTDRGATAMHLAAEKRMYRFLRKSRNYKMPIMRDFDGNTPLHYLANEQGMEQKLSDLLMILDDDYFQKQFFSRNNRLETPLDTALCTADRGNDSSLFVGMCNVYSIIDGENRFFIRTKYMWMCDKCVFVPNLCLDLSVCQYPYVDLAKCMNDPPPTETTSFNDLVQSHFDELEAIIGHIPGRTLIDYGRRRR